MKETIVIALGGNALQVKGEAPTIANQIKNISIVVDEIIKLIEKDYNVIITHGNGPQVGRILLQQEIANSEELPSSDLDICVAMSQASIGVCIQQVLESKLKEKNIKKEVATIVTEVVVSKDDQAFKNPTKPIGQYYTKEEAQNLEKTKGYVLKEDSGKGYRRVVGSPKPKQIKQLEIIKQLSDAGNVVICCGGGGVPVIYEDHKYQGIAGVIDKDSVSSLLACELDVDKLVILTAVSEVCINYNQEDEIRLHQVDTKYLSENLNEFGKGSMLEKVEACINFSEKTGKESIITDLLNLNISLTTKENGTIIIK